MPCCACARACWIGWRDDCDGLTVVCPDRCLCAPATLNSLVLAVADERLNDAVWALPCGVSQYTAALLLRTLLVAFAPSSELHRPGGEVTVDAVHALWRATAACLSDRADVVVSKLAVNVLRLLFNSPVVDGGDAPPPPPSSTPLVVDQTALQAWLSTVVTPTSLQYLRSFVHDAPDAMWSSSGVTSVTAATPSSSVSTSVPPQSTTSTSDSAGVTRPTATTACALAVATLSVQYADVTALQVFACAVFDVAMALLLDETFAHRATVSLTVVATVVNIGSTHRVVGDHVSSVLPRTVVAMQSRGGGLRADAFSILCQVCGRLPAMQRSVGYWCVITPLPLSLWRTPAVGRRTVGAVWCGCRVGCVLSYCRALSRWTAGPSFVAPCWMLTR